MLKLLISVMTISAISLAAPLQAMKSQLSAQQNQALKVFNTSEKLAELLKKRNAKDLKKTGVTLMSQSISSMGEGNDNVCEIVSKWQVSKSFINKTSSDLETITMNITTATVDQNCGERNSKINTFVDTEKTENMKVIQIN